MLVFTTHYTVGVFISVFEMSELRLKGLQFIAHLSETHSSPTDLLTCLLPTGSPQDLCAISSSNLTAAL